MSAIAIGLIVFALVFDSALPVSARRSRQQYLIFWRTGRH